MMAYRSSKQLSTDQIPNIPSPFFKNLKYDIKNIRFLKKNVRPCTNLFSFRGLFVHYLQNWKRSFIIIISHTFVEIKTSYMRNYKCVRALIDITLVVLQLLWKTYINYFQSVLLLKWNQIIMTLYSWGDLRNIVLVIFV